MKVTVFLILSCCCFMQFQGGVGSLASDLFSNCTALQTFLGVSYYQLNASGSEPDLSKVRIDLHTASKTVKYNLSSAVDILSDPGFNKSLPITILVHGFLTTVYNEFATIMTSSMIKQGKTNVLYLDASSVILVYYSRASVCIRFVGDALGVQLWKLVQAGVDPNQIHLIGHSLGAHISGIAAKKFTSLSGGLKVARVSGMDPAGPCFYNSSSDLILSSTDATFVDVFHTNAGFLGIIKPIGQVDFFPNGGEEQPGANPLSDDSHTRSWRIMAESALNPQNFIASKCPNWNSFQKGLCANNETTTMGYYTTPGTTGIYYLRTAAFPLYGLKVPGATPTDFTKWWYNSFL